MALSEESRHALHNRLDTVLGPDEAATLMEYLPPVGWADVATKHDLDALAERMDLRFENVDLRFDAVDRRFEAVDHRFDAVDRRLDAMDHRFEAMDLRFDSMDRRIDGLSGRVDGLTASLDARLRNNLIATLTIMAALLAAFAAVIKL